MKYSVSDLTLPCSPFRVSLYAFMFTYVTMSTPLPFYISCQWHGQNEQVTWAHHRHIQCTPSMHLLGEMGHAPAIKVFWIIHPEIASEAVLGNKYHSFKSYLYARFMSTFKQSHMLITAPWPYFPHYLYPEFYVGTSLGMPGCSYGTGTDLHALSTWHPILILCHGNWLIREGSTSWIVWLTFAHLAPWSFIRLSKLVSQFTFVSAHIS